MAMVVGFNHNFRYKDTVYHVQTEDGGIKFPAIITHLFIGGTILKTKKTSYADIIKTDRLEQVVEELMKEQHRDMLRRLRSGEFDQIIEKFQKHATLGVGKKIALPEVREAAPPTPPTPTPQPIPKSAAVAPPAPAVAAASRTSAPPDMPKPAVESSLDDIILSYLMGEKSP